MCRCTAGWKKKKRENECRRVGNRIEGKMIRKPHLCPSRVGSGRSKI